MSAPAAPAGGVTEATPEQIAAAWRAFRAERQGSLIGPGPAFREAISAALATTRPDPSSALAAAAAARSDPPSALAVIDRWSRPDHLRLHAGEMTAGEMRTVLAMLGGVRAEVARLRADGGMAELRAEVERLTRERDWLLAQAGARDAEVRQEAFERAAKIADEWAAENLRMAMDSIHLDPALNGGDFSAAAQRKTEAMQAHGAHHAGAHAGCEQVAAAIRALAQQEDK